MSNSHLTIDRCCVFTRQQLCTGLDETHEPLVFGNLVLPSLCLVCSSLKLPGHLLSGINRKWKLRSSEGPHSALLMKIRLWGCGCGGAVLRSLELTGVKARQSLTFGLDCVSLTYIHCHTDRITVPQSWRRHVMSRLLKFSQQGEQPLMWFQIAFDLID